MCHVFRRVKGERMKMLGSSIELDTTSVTPATTKGGEMTEREAAEYAENEAKNWMITALTRRANLIVHEALASDSERER